jgi:Zn-dependent protease
VIAFRIFGIPVRVQPFFMILAVLLGVLWSGDHADGTVMFERVGAVMAVVFTGILAHELGHAFAGRMFGLAPRIELHGLGGLTSWDAGGRDLTPGRSIIVSFAGPAVGIVIGSVALVLALATATPIERGGGFPSFLAWTIVFVNLGWGILNLIPMMPLDGGNIMASTFELFAGRSGVAAARWISLGVAALIVLICVAAGELIMAFLVGWLAYGNLRAARVERAVGPDKALLGRLATAQRRLDAGDPRGAEMDAQKILAEAKTALVRSHALTILALSRLAMGDATGARECLNQMPRSHPPDAGIEAAVLLESGDADAAFELLAKKLNDRQGPFVEQRFLDATQRTGRFDEAAAVLDTPRGRSVDIAILEAFEETAYRAEAHSAAARIGQILWDVDRRPTRAYNVACALSRAGREDEAMGWLAQARKAGFDKIDLLDGDADLAPLRDRADWAELRRAFGA